MAALVGALVCVSTGLVAVGPADAAERVRKPRAMYVGSVQVHRCDVLPRALCGSILRLWDPKNPSAGRVRVGFAFVPARNRKRPVLGTLVPHEGGPGYSTTGTGESYAQMYGTLLRRRNLLLVDQNGTGRSQPINCPALQNLTIAYNVAAERCGKQLGARADDYSTALSADDLAEVIRRLGLGRVDLYGDSYGTFFTQVFTGRHPASVRSLVLDGAYPTYGESAWYPTQSPAVRQAFDLTCRRSVACRNAGQAFLPTLTKVLGIVRTMPWRGVSHDADGRRARVRVNGPTLVTVALNATFTPTAYRELTAALRSALGAGRRSRTAAATGGGGPGGRHGRRRPGRLQRGPPRSSRLPRLSAALRHDGAAKRARATVRRGARRANPDEPVNLRAVHGARVRPPRLADARPVHALAGGSGQQPRRAAQAARWKVPVGAGARPQR